MLSSGRYQLTSHQQQKRSFHHHLSSTGPGLCPTLYLAAFHQGHWLVLDCFDLLCLSHSSVSSPLTVSPSSGARATLSVQAGHSAYSDPLNPVRAEHVDTNWFRGPTQGSYWSVFPLGSQENVKSQVKSPDQG